MNAIRSDATVECLTFERAVEIAARAHQGQTDKQGVVYLLHPLRVALAASDDARRVAVLHDVVEDSATTLDDLRREGLPEEEVEAVAFLTKLSEEESDYAAFIERVANAQGRAGVLAREVKLADVRDNLGRQPESNEPEWMDRRERYERAIERLTSAIAADAKRA